MKKYVIRNIKRNNYYAKHISNEISHFVCDVEEARKFNSKKQAINTINKIGKQENYEIKEYYI